MRSGSELFGSLSSSGGGDGGMDWGLLSVRMGYT